MNARNCDSFASFGLLYRRNEGRLEILATWTVDYEGEIKRPLKFAGGTGESYSPGHPESPESAYKREVFQESGKGIIVTEVEKAFSTKKPPNHLGEVHCMHWFLVRKFEGDVIWEGNKDDSPAFWVPSQEFEEKLIYSHRNSYARLLRMAFKREEGLEAFYRATNPKSVLD